MYECNCEHRHEYDDFDNLLKATKNKGKFLQDDVKPHDLKYMQDLMDDFTLYISQLVLNIFNGVSSNLGIKNPDMLSARSPREKRLEKGFLSGMIGIGRRIKKIIGRKIKKSPFEEFKLKGLKLYKKGKPLTNQQWTNFEKQVVDYLHPFLDSLGEEMAVKGILLAMASNEMERQGRSVAQYGKKSYEQLENEAFHGYVPDSMLSAEERYDIDQNTKQAITLAYTRAADYVTNTSDMVRDAVKQQVITAHRLGKSHTELASDLYWMHEDKPELRDHTAEIVMRDWRRVAKTELAYIHEQGKMAQYESQARKSIDNPDEAVYLVFNGTGRCDWCSPRQGTVVRLLAINDVGNEKDDSLSSRGIDDPHTNIAVWQGKNNVGYKKAKWRICAPVHPWCGDTFSRIYPEKQTYDKETGRIKYTAGKEFERFIPGDFLDEIESEKAKYRKRQDLLEKQRAASLINEEKKKKKKKR